MVKIIWHKATSLPHMDSSVLFASVTPITTPQSASTLYWCCPRLSCFEYIDCWTCLLCHEKAPFHPQYFTFMWRSGPHLKYKVHLGPREYSEWHHDRFIHFCRTDRPCYSICSKRLHLASAAMWPNNTTIMFMVLSQFTCFIWWMHSKYQVPANPHTKPTVCIHHRHSLSLLSKRWHPFYHPTAVMLHSVCPRLHITVAVVINTTACGEIWTAVLSHHSQASYH